MIFSITKKSIKYLFNPLINVFKKRRKREDISKNVFRRNYKKTVLISYLRESFNGIISKRHTNIKECYTAGEIFDELGYIVDVVDYNNFSSIIKYENYDVIYGMGEALEKAFYNDVDKRILTIFYATGCSPYYSNKVTMNRVLDHYLDNGKLIPASSRLVSNQWTGAYTLSDAVIVLGNSFVKNTYYQYKGRPLLYNLPAFFYRTTERDIVKQKNWERARTNILWFGSSGLIHKGLDLVIESVLAFEDIVLHICGASPNEVQFYSEYEEYLCRPNTKIINHGFVHLDSEEFNNVLVECGFVILPSISEGGSPSILTVIGNGGCIPLIPASAGLDLDGLEIGISEVTTEGVKSALEVALSKSEYELKLISEEIYNLVNHKYTYENYKGNLRNTILKILSIKEKNNEL